MAYVESYYLDTNEDQVIAAPQQLDPNIQQETVDTPNVVVQEAATKEVSSDYCGMINEDIPPIYREQIRQNIRSKHAALSDSKYFALPTQDAKKSHIEHSALYTNDYQTLDSFSVHEYVPGFSPPAHESHEQRQNRVLSVGLPIGKFVAATEHKFQIPRTPNVEESAYLGMTTETEQSAHKSHTGSFSEQSSVMTAVLGPELGAKSVAVDRYHGLNAFKPVTQTGGVESHYAHPDIGYN